MLEKVEPIDVPPERKRIRFQFPPAGKSGRTVMTLTHARKAYGDKVVLRDVSLHIERGDRIALVGHNGAGKSTLMRLLSGAEAPDSGECVQGHDVVMQYFAQDEATRLNPALTVHETLADGSPHAMIPAIRNILGGFLFSGDDIFKKAGVLSGGERTRLAVARMLLHPSNTLLLDEPTNHLDLDSKDVLLEALEDYGGTLIFVSHDRYFVDRLATKIIDVGGGEAVMYPGNYEAYLWRQQQHSERTTPEAPAPQTPRRAGAPAAAAPAAVASRDYAARKRDEAELRRHDRARKALAARIAELETRIAEAEGRIKALEAQMAEPAFYADPAAARAATDGHQALMWTVGDLLGQWEMLTTELEASADPVPR